jgi:hypothetical protein
MTSKIAERKFSNRRYSPRQAGTSQPTSVRFYAEDLALIARLQKRWKTANLTATIREALQLAENQNGDKR